MIPIRCLAGRRVAVFGLGLSGIATAIALREGGARVVAWDDSEAAREKARDLGVPVDDLDGVGWHELSALVLAPGVPLTHPEPHWTVRKARAARVEVIGDTELFFRELDHSRSRARVIAITGTNGKSTTTALVAHLLRAAGRAVAVGGNIGKAVLDLKPPEDDLIYVVEFSSYQIDLTPTLNASSAALLNITPDHLDRHGGLENYAAVKARIFSCLGDGARAVIAVDDDRCRRIADGLDEALDVVRVSTAGRLASGVLAEDGRLLELAGGEIQSSCEIDGIASLRGVHNWQNAAVAFALARGEGLEPAEIASGLRSFPGLAHRMEQVGRLGKILLINDSKATNAAAAAKALASFESIYWIVGGLAKDGGLAGLEPYFPRIRRAYLIGAAAPCFARHLDGRVDHEICGTIGKALSSAVRDAGRGGGREPVVLFSPACASFDQFGNFALRGEAFRDAVNSLPGVTPHERTGP